MKKMYFSLDKYRKNLLDMGITKGIIDLMSKNDKIFDEQEIIFLHRRDTWGFVEGKKDWIHRDWCVAKHPSKNFFQRIFGRKDDAIK